MWMSIGLMKSSRTRDILNKKPVKNNTTETYWTNLIEYRNQFN